ncbi:hypothetical protein [Leptospira kirschneri]|uniref:hypothetical protein n=1 Tax=Leptospira kirschneri TaxID=29507 RepID=UPI0020C997A7|nr:hypothetical protein [Leptospira kirschneri]
MVEIVSKRTVTKDTVEKKQSMKNPELWLVFPELQYIEISFCENERYYLHSSTDLSPSRAESKFLKDRFLILDVLFPNEALYKIEIKTKYGNYHES